MGFAEDHVHTMFITNNHASFHLWWKENLVKYQEVSKYFDHDCWFVLRSFFLVRLLFISINLPYGFAWNTVVMSGMLLSTAAWIIDKPRKRICRTDVPSQAASLELLAHIENIVSLSLFYRYYFGWCSSELADLVPFPHSRGSSTRWSSNSLHDFSVTIPRCYRDVYVNSFFPCTARLWNFWPAECFPLVYDLTGFKSRASRHILSLGSF